MKILIAIPTCVKHSDRHIACMETWATVLPRNYYDPRNKAGDDVEVRLFCGEEVPLPQNDTQYSITIVPSTGNSLSDLPSIIQGICVWALFRGYDYLLKVDSDTFVWIDRMMKSGWWQHDYTGWTQPKFPDKDNYASGGAGYWLSAKAMAIVAAANLTDDTSEDRWVGRVLYDGGIAVHRDERYAHGDDREPFKDKTLVTFHPASPKRMRELFNGGNT